MPPRDLPLPQPLSRSELEQVVLAIARVHLPLTTQAWMELWDAHPAAFSFFLADAPPGYGTVSRFNPCPQHMWKHFYRYFSSLLYVEPDGTPTPRSADPSVRARIGSSTLDDTPLRVRYIEDDSSRTPFLSYGSQADAARDTVFTEKPRVGFLATYLGPRTDSDGLPARRFHYLSTDKPSLRYVVGAQHLLADDCAALSNKEVQADLFPTVTKVDYPRTHAAIREALLTGEIKDIRLFAESRDSLTNADAIVNALRALLDELSLNYHPTCVLRKDIHQLISSKDVPRWVAAAKAAARAAGQPDFSAQKAAAAHVIDRINFALESVYNSAFQLLKTHFLAFPLRLDPATGQGYRRISAMPSAEFRPLGFLAALQGAPAFAPASGPARGKKRPGYRTSGRDHYTSDSDDGAAAKRGSSYSAPSDSPDDSDSDKAVISVSTTEIPKKLAPCKGLSLFNALKKFKGIRRLYVGGNLDRNLCAKFLLRGNGPGGCSNLACEREHLKTKPWLDFQTVAKPSPSS